MSNKRPTLTKKTRDMHGYVVIQELEKLDLFNGEKIDNTGIYRTL